MTGRLNYLFYITVLYTAFILNYSLPVSAKEICSGGYSCAITEERADNKISVSIKNLLPYEITVTIEFSKLDNLRPDVPVPYTLTVPGNETITVVTLEKIDINETWEYYFKFFSVEGNINAEHNNNFVYVLPYASGQSFFVTQGFNGSFSHNGEQKYAIDWAMPEGTEIFASRSGTVAGIKDDSNTGGKDKKFAGQANYIIIRHSDGTFGAYLHLKKNGVRVKLGQEIKTGDVIGLSGNTGWSGAPHLHFWVYKAKNGRERKSFPIRFKTSDDDSVILSEGNYYTAP